MSNSDGAPGADALGRKDMKKLDEPFPAAYGARVRVIYARDINHQRENQDGSAANQGFCGARGWTLRTAARDFDTLSRPG